MQQKQTIEDAQADNFLPGAPSPGITIPTTTYGSTRALPRNLLPADFYSVQKRHAHLPLLVMLVLTQLSVGAFATELLQSRLLGEAAAPSRPYHALFALVTGLLALGTSVLHLGRPLLAFRAILGIRTSWMSREILAFALFAKFAVLYAAALWHVRLAELVGVPAVSAIAAERLQGVLGVLVATSGALGVFCSAMIYASTRRRYWSAPSTGFKFFMSAALLGAGSGLLSVTASRLVSSSYDARHAVLTEQLGFAVIVLAVSKLLVEFGIFFHLYDPQHTDLKRAALLMKGELSRSTRTRFAAGALGGILLPALLSYGCSADDFTGPIPVVLATTALLLVLVGELFERRLFFSALCSPRMPGGLR